MGVAVVLLQYICLRYSLMEKKHVNIERELKNISFEKGNRECFDCGQNGVTYANMTLGTFVCTKCCGILRGLNPCHRMKSLSVCKFNESDLKFLQSKGNKYMKKLITDDYITVDYSLLRKDSDDQLKKHLILKYSSGRMLLLSSQEKKGTSGIPTSNKSDNSEPCVNSLIDEVSDDKPAGTIYGKLTDDTDKGADSYFLGMFNKNSNDNNWDAFMDCTALENADASLDCVIDDCKITENAEIINKINSNSIDQTDIEEDLFSSVNSSSVVFEFEDDLFDNKEGTSMMNSKQHVIPKTKKAFNVDNFNYFDDIKSYNNVQSKDDDIFADLVDIWKQHALK
ncbi:hypothetical protein GJ496_007905 [Pomphorhynchus laevis]|nr:hypothetical protein GJ496_007905 [Pomphorhynchus laevis]